MPSRNGLRFPLHTPPAAWSVATWIARLRGQGARQSVPPVCRSVSVLACRHHPNAAPAVLAVRAGRPVFRAWGRRGCGRGLCADGATGNLPRTHWPPACILQSICARRCGALLQCARFCRCRQKSFAFQRFQIPLRHACGGFSAKLERACIRCAGCFCIRCPLNFPANPTLGCMSVARAISSRPDKTRMISRCLHK